METTKITIRPLYEIAAEIKKDWKNIYFGAVPYLDAMSTMTNIKNNYGQDPGYEIVIYFLANATTWRGDTARRIKSELNDMYRNNR